MTTPMKSVLGAVILCTSALALSACVYDGPYRDGYYGRHNGQYYDRDRYHHDYDRSGYDRGDYDHDGD